MDELVIGCYEALVFCSQLLMLRSFCSVHALVKYLELENKWRRFLICSYGLIKLEFNSPFQFPVDTSC